jgi:hypothetical protein
MGDATVRFISELPPQKIMNYMVMIGMKRIKYEIIDISYRSE